MVREDLDDIPWHALPKDFSARWYEPGDEQVWRRIQSEADRFNTITQELFASEFGNDPVDLAERQCYLLAGSQGSIGTATAWYDENHRGMRYGRIHWVAILPQWQGRGLSKPLMSIVCNRLRGLGHTRAYLTTSTVRIVALNLYLEYGFLPEISGPGDFAAWRKVEPELKYPIPWRKIEGA